MRSNPPRTVRSGSNPPGETVMFISKFVALIATCLALNALAADANSASQAELESVKGIGPGLSSKIIKAREAGAFKGWDDLVERVGGVGPGNAARFSQAGLTVAGAAYDGKPVEAKGKKEMKGQEMKGQETKEPRKTKKASAQDA
jgi:competence protein ComEA